MKNRAFGGRQRIRGIAINQAAPTGTAERSKAQWMRLHEQGFGPAIAALLTQKGANRKTPVMPNHRTWNKLQFSALFTQSPAHIHIIARRLELRTEAANRLQRWLANRQIAARQVLGFFVVEQHV